MATTPAVSSCSICGRAMPNLTPRTLYGFAVCPDDYQKFMLKRSFAHIIDIFFYSIFFAIVFWGFLIAAAILVGATSTDTSPAAAGPSADIIVRLWLLLIPLGMFGRVLLDGFRGHSPGKAILGLQVIDERDGRPAGFWDSMQRNLILLVPFMPLIIAVLLFQGDGHRLGDGWARTKVIWKDYRHTLPFLSQHDQKAWFSDATGRFTALPNA
jgi:uncharacterized RDD family membrane protein YckC